MRLLDDERGQSVQVGAAILLGFVVIAITMYQVEVVSSQNAEVEFNHDQEVRQDMVDLRNSISNAGTQGEGDSTSVKLGTQYPPRTIFVNPPPIQGAFRSQEAGNISFGNAEVEGSYGGRGNATDLVHSNHSTNRLTYVPRYFELDDAGATSIEHSLAFKSFENNATDPLTRQPVIGNNGTLTLTVVKGNVSEQGAQSVSLDPETVSSPTDSVTITNSSSGPIELYLPTETPSVWNETIGTTVTDGANGSRVAAWDSDAGVITVELVRDQYDLQMALVGVGEGVSGSDRYHVTSEQSSGGNDGGGSTGQYSLEWQDPSSEPVTEEPCDGESCVWNLSKDSDTHLDLTAELSPELDGVDIDFAVSNASVATVSNDGESTDGTRTANLSPRADGTVDVYATSDEGSDVITMELQNTESGGTSGPPSEQNGIRYDGNLGSTASNSAVQFDITNVGSGFARVQAVSVTARNGVDSEIFNNDESGHQHEIDISGGNPDGYEDVSGKPKDVSLTADGRTISLDQNAVLTDTGSSQTATVFVSQFGSSAGNNFNPYTFGSLQHVESSDTWDVSVTLQFQTRENVTFYFDET